MSVSSRRTLLASAAAGGLLATGPLASAQGTGGPGASGPGLAGGGGPSAQDRAVADPGPRNEAMEHANTSEFTPPPTDHGNLGTLKYSFSQAHNRRTEAGWAREVTVRNFPIAKRIAGVNMRLGPNAVRELHWHLPAEWAYMIDGAARITAVDQESRHFAADVKAGDLWYFPSGIPHSIQATGADGCEFLLAFDDGSFSEDSTFLITDWFAHTPKDVLAKNFNVPASAFDRIPQKERYIFNARPAGPLEGDLHLTAQPLVPEPFNFALADQPPVRTRGGTVRIADVTNFKASKSMSAALVEVEPGGMRELHWHPLSDEWQYYLSGTARMTVFASEGHANTVDFAASDVGYVPRSMGHYIENTGSDTLRYLEIFHTGRYSDMSLANWMANTPHQLVADHLDISESVLAGLPIDKKPVVPV